MLDEHGGEIAADLLRYYGVDIRDLFTGRLSPRFALALVENLPIESATFSSRISEGERAAMGWDRNTYLLAEVVDVLQVLHTTLVRVNSSNPKKVKNPDPYGRPGQKERKRRENTSNPFANALAASDSVEIDAGGEMKSFSIPSNVRRSTKSDPTEGQPFQVN